MRTETLPVWCVLILSLAIGAQAAAQDLSSASGPRLVAPILRLAAPPVSSRPSRIQVDLALDGPPLPPRLAEAAMGEVTRVWAPYGVDVETLRPGDGGRHGAIRLAVKLADRPARQAAAKALGSIQFLGDAPEPAIVLYQDAIEGVVSTVKIFGRENREWPVALCHFILGRVLGRALAHEIGHFLLRSRQHSAAGLMRSDLAPADLVDPDRRPFALSVGDAARLMSVTRND
ncbi:MAG: hypothetical protein ABJA98_17995 [Acidobacteriota bacterium]